jgi:hypothetical protein
MAQKAYLLEWLDLLITVTLNPQRTNVDSITDEQAQFMLSQTIKEEDRVRLGLTNQIFSLTKEKQIELLVKQYHSALIVLLDHAVDNQKGCGGKRQPLKDVCKAVITCFNELLSFIEVRFSAYLGLEERVPVTYLAVSKKELRRRLAALKETLGQRAGDQRLAEIIFHKLASFTDNTDDHDVTFRELLYVKELVKELKALDEPAESLSVYSVLDELLIYLNFNSKAYQNHFTQAVARKINACESFSDKLDGLLFYFKEFKQLHRKSGVVLNPQQADLKTAIGNWFTQEIFYLEKKLHLSIIPLNSNQVQPSSQKDKPKVMCILSVDQMGILLRAADELKIISARSLNSVFRSLAPHLSTPYQENISYDSMRSKSYIAETRDKQILTQTLQQLIEKIDDY